MNKKIKDFIDQLFINTPSTTYVEELKEEMLMNLCEKYEDLLVEGKTKEEAYLIVTSSVGDIRELISGLDESAVIITTKDIEKRKRKSALVTSIAVGMYILCGAILIGMSMLEHIIYEASTFGVVIILPIIAIATGLLIYDSATKPEVLKEENKDYYKKKNMTVEQRRREGIQEAIRGLIWVVAIAIYVLFGVVMGAWSYAWVIFIIAVALQSIVGLIFKLKE